MAIEAMEQPAFERLTMRIRELLQYVETLEKQLEESREKHRMAMGVRDEQAREATADIERTLKRLSEAHGVIEPQRDEYKARFRSEYGPGAVMP